MVDRHNHGFKFFTDLIDALSKVAGRLKAIVSSAQSRAGGAAPDAR